MLFNVGKSGEPDQAEVMLEQLKELRGDPCGYRGENILGRSQQLRPAHQHEQELKSFISLRQVYKTPTLQRRKEPCKSYKEPSAGPQGAQVTSVRLHNHLRFFPSTVGTVSC